MFLKRQSMYDFGIVKSFFYWFRGFIPIFYITHVFPLFFLSNDFIPQQRFYTDYFVLSYSIDVVAILSYYICARTYDILRTKMQKHKTDLNIICYSEIGIGVCQLWYMFLTYVGRIIQMSRWRCKANICDIVCRTNTV